MAFKLKEDVYTVQTRHALLGASITVKVGDVIVPDGASSSVTNATGKTAGDFYVLGVVTGFCKQNGEVISQGQDPANTPNQLITTATNLTTEKYHAVYVPITANQEWYGDLGAAIGTTLADLNFVWYNLSDCRTVSESTAVVYATGETTPLQVLLIDGVDPLVSAGTRGIFKFVKYAGNHQ